MSCSDDFIRFFDSMNQMYHQFASDVYTVGQHDYDMHVNKMRRRHSEQLIPTHANVPSPTLYNLNSTIEFEPGSLTRVNYSPKKIFSLATSATNRRNSISCTPKQNRISSSFDRYSPIEENSSLCVRSTPTQMGTPSFDKYLSPSNSFDSSRQNVRNTSNSYQSLDAAMNNWSLLSNNSKTPIRARASSTDSPRNMKQLLDSHFSPCSCKDDPKRGPFASPVAADSFTCPSSASTPSLLNGSAPSPQRVQTQTNDAVLEPGRKAAKEIPSPLNIYLHTRKRQSRVLGSGSGYHCHACQ